MPHGRWSAWGSVAMVTVLAAAAAVLSASATASSVRPRIPTTATAVAARVTSAARAGVPSTTAPPSTTTPPTTTPPPATSGPDPTVPSAPTSTTTSPTTTTPMPVCQASQFAVTLATDDTTYTPGETVTISLTVRHTSPQACLDTDVMVWGCFGATVADAAGDDVWESWAGPDSTPASCGTTGFPTTIPGDDSTTEQLSWTQDDCTQPVTNGQPNPDCPQTPVPPGPYEITGRWTVFPSPPPVTIEISSS